MTSEAISSTFREKAPEVFLGVLAGRPSHIIARIVSAQQVRFKVAGEAEEFEQVFRLAYETFVEEIPQHPPNAERRHVDRFHDENTYVIALDGDELVGMCAIRGERPFSLDLKVGNVDDYLPPGRQVCELRLLAVRAAYRRGPVFRGLVDLVVRHGRAQGYDLAIISGTLRQEKLYKHFGFIPFASLVGSDEAPFQPMYLSFERFKEMVPVLAPQEDAGTATPERLVSFLPGPVTLSDDVRAAFERPPAYHRDVRFKTEFARVKTRLCRLVQSRNVQILLGSGTLSNDVVGAQISLLESPGLVVSNGEFGDRLIDHARRLQLPHEAVAYKWGEPFDESHIEAEIRRTGAAWLWAVVSETSTGMLNDVEMLKRLARCHGLKLCLDCVSAIGAIPLDLRGVHLSTGASGKALAAFPGLSVVFHDHVVRAEPARLPRYLDLGYYAEKDGIPFTHSSNLVAALDVALNRFETSEPFEQIVELSTWLRPRLRDLGFNILVPDADATPAVVTLVMSDDGAAVLGDALERQGMLVAYQSEYLVRRNWLQIGLMGHVSKADLTRLATALEKTSAVAVRQR